MFNESIVQSRSQEVDPEFALVIEAIHECLVEGKPVDIESLVARAPKHADAIREHVVAMQAMAGLSQDNRSGKAAQRDGSAPRQLGEFTIVREIGRGGMGTVFEAIQGSMGRRVALKVLPFAALADERSITRFHNEVRAAASLDHPNVVSIYSFGIEQGVHYYAMQLIRGTNLAEVIREHRVHANDLEANGDDDVPALTEAIEDHGTQKSSSDVAGQRETVAMSITSTARSSDHRRFYQSIAEMVRQAAAALHHAHTLGVVHRDIKPSNLLVDTNGKLWITDFGLAQIESDMSVTLTGDIVGTLKYMSPEQAAGDRVNVDRRTDIYSLGATLYELLAQRPPFEAEDRRALLTRILQADPLPLRGLEPTIPADLETICMKCLSKAPSERYATAQELSDDLERFLIKQPIVARPPTMLDRVSKWAQRNRSAAVSAIAISLLMALASTVGLLWASSVNRRLSLETNRTASALKKERQAKAEVVAAHRESSRNLYLAKMRQTHTDYQAGQIRRMFRTLEQFVPRPGEFDQRGWEWYYLIGLCQNQDQVLRDLPVDVKGVHWHPNGSHLGICGINLYRIWDLETGRPRAQFGHGASFRSATLHPDGGRLATTHGDDKLRLWNIATGEIDRTIDVESSENSKLYKLGFSPDGTMLACEVGDARWKIFDVETCKLIWEREIPIKNEGYQSFAWSPDSRYVVCCGGSIEIWDVRKNELVFERSKVQDAACVAWMKGFVAYAGFEKKVELYDVDSERWQDLFTLDEPVTCLAWSDDGHYLAVGTTHQIVLWDQRSKQITDRLRGHTDMVNALSWKPQQHVLLSYSVDHTIRTWTPKRTEDSEEPVLQYGTVVSHDRRSVALISSDKDEVTIRSVGSGMLQRRFPVSVHRTHHQLIWSNDDQYIGCNDVNGGFLMWDIRRDESTLFTRPEYESMAMAAFANRNPWIAVTFNAKDPTNAGDAEAVAVVVYDLRSQKALVEIEPGEAHALLVKGISWSPDDQMVAVSGYDGRRAITKIWSAVDGREMHSLEDPTNWARSLAWHPDGHHVATGGFSGEAYVRDLRSPSKTKILEGHRDRLKSFSWSGDGTRLVTKSSGELRIWDPFEGVEILEIRDDSPRFRSSKAYFDGQELRFEDPYVGDLETAKGRRYAGSHEFTLDRALMCILDGDIDAASEHLESCVHDAGDGSYAQKLLTAVIAAQIHFAGIQNREHEFESLIERFRQHFTTYAVYTLTNRGDENFVGMSDLEILAGRTINSITQLWRPNIPAPLCLDVLTSMEETFARYGNSMADESRASLLNKIESARKEILAFEP